MTHLPVIAHVLLLVTLSHVSKLPEGPPLPDPGQPVDWTQETAQGEPQVPSVDPQLAEIQRALEAGDLASARASLVELWGSGEAGTEGAVLQGRGQQWLVELGKVAAGLGRLDIERGAQEELLKVMLRDLAVGHSDLVPVKSRLAVLRAQTGDLDGAKGLFEEVHDYLEENVEADDSDLLTAKQNLAVIRKRFGRLGEARELEEYVHAAQERLLPRGHADLLLAKQNLAVTVKTMGDLPFALELEEHVYKLRSELLDPDHPSLLAAKANLAVTRKMLGDFSGAHELEEQVHSARVRLLPPDHPGVLFVKQNLGVTRAKLGDHEGARELFAYVRDAWAPIFPPDHPDLLPVTMNLASSLRALGDVTGALKLFEEGHAAFEASMPKGHPDLLTAKFNLAVLRHQVGDSASAKTLLEEVHSMRAEVLPQDHPDLHDSKLYLAASRASTNDLSGAFELCRDMAVGAQKFARLALFAAPREARATSKEAASRLGKARIWSAAAPPDQELLQQFFNAMETIRYVGADGPARFQTTAAQEAQEVKHMRLAVRASSDAIERHIAIGPREPAGTDPVGEGSLGDALDLWNRELAQLCLDRDAQERDLMALVQEAGGFADVIDMSAIADRLREGDAAIGLHKIEIWREEVVPMGGVDESVERQWSSKGSHYLGYCIGSDGRVVEVDLGPAVKIEAAVSAWRASLGAPTRGRGVEVQEDAEGDELALGRALRRQLFDPLARAAASVPGATLYVCLDDALHAVPFDALPLESEGSEGGQSRGTRRVGDLFQVHADVSFARWIVPRTDLGDNSSLTVVGGVSYDEVDDSSAGEVASGEGSSLWRGEGAPSEAWATWPALPGTAEEAGLIESTARQFLGIEPDRLHGAGVTRRSLEQAVMGKRYLHIATHGWFMPMSVQSILDADQEGGPESLLGSGRTVTGFAPLALCGLVLSGANAARTPVQRSASLLSAMEVSSFDLRSCDLAVLSACETNVGIIRAGQGIQSLQTALHQAGARTSLTSLWRVEDGATRDLMAHFYSNLWSKKMGKAKALWDAKKQLRLAGAPAMHWAGWVLSGDPD